MKAGAGLDGAWIPKLEFRGGGCEEAAFDVTKIPSLDSEA